MANSFDEIMQHAPFLKEVIENKIADETGSRGRHIEAMQSTIDELMLIILMYQAQTLGMEGK